MITVRDFLRVLEDDYDELSLEYYDSNEKGLYYFPNNAFENVVGAGFYPESATLEYNEDDEYVVSDYYTADQIYNSEITKIKLIGTFIEIYINI